MWLKLKLEYLFLLFCLLQKAEAGGFCPTPRNIPNGQFNPVDGPFGPGISITYSCNDNYELEGDATSICSDSLMWSPPNIQVCVPDEDECPGGKWTQFFDVDNPTGKGDFETVGKIRHLHPKRLCDNPRKVQAKVIGSPLPYTTFGQDVTLSVGDGLLCQNRPDEQCLDYKVRFCCPRVYCPDDAWTAWMDRDNPSGQCDCEDLPLLRETYPDMICKKPVAFDSRVKGTFMFYRDTAQVFSFASKKKGLRCVNADNPGGCSDYEVRFCCPKEKEPQCDPEDWTPFLNSDKPSGKGDFETLANLRAKFPEEICARPTEIDARVAPGGPSYAHSTDDVEVGLAFGLKCVNEEQYNKRCNDYEVRFCCPTKPKVPKCRDGKWTRFYNVDNPITDGDYELLSAIRDLYPEEVCQFPQAVDARLASNGNNHFRSGQNVAVDNGVGLVCENVGQQCKDYMIRFCCPSDCNVCKAGDWTRFFDEDNPDNEGDLEKLSVLQADFPDDICDSPVKTDARLLNGDHYTAAGQTVDLSDGFACYNSDSQQCCDYKVRFCCPSDNGGFCPTPRNIPNGQFNPVDGPFGPGTTITYSCNGNYELEGDATSICSDDLTWSPPNVQVCVPDGCPTPDMLENGAFSPSMGPYNPGDVVEHSCDDDFIFTGLKDPSTFRQICLDDRTWFPPLARLCEVRRDCPIPPPLANGAFFPTNAPFYSGLRVRYHCDCNFILQGNPVIMCLNTGVWFLNGERNCVPSVCPTPDNIDQGSFDAPPGPYIPGTILTYSCDDPTMYDLVGFNEVICQTDYTWAPEFPTCRPSGDTFVGFVIDDTGSMLNEISAVKNWINLCIDGLNPTCGMMPTGGFTVSPFNDPNTGPVNAGITPEQAVIAVNNLNPNGGGDCPELAYRGLIDALNTFPDINGGCIIYLITDATAKDGASLGTQTLALFGQKGCQFVPVLTGCCGTCPAACNVLAAPYCTNGVRDLRNSPGRKKRQAACTSLPGVVAGTLNLGSVPAGGFADGDSVTVTCDSGSATTVTSATCNAATNSWSPPTLTCTAACTSLPGVLAGTLNPGSVPAGGFADGDSVTVTCDSGFVTTITSSTCDASANTWAPPALTCTAPVASISFYMLAEQTNGRIFLFPKNFTSGTTNFGENLANEMTLGFCPTRLFAGPIPNGYVNRENCELLGACWHSTLAKCFCSSQTDPCPRQAITECGAGDNFRQRVHLDCRQYIQCTAGVLTLETCPGIDVFHASTSICVAPNTIPPPCGTAMP